MPKEPRFTVHSHLKDGALWAEDFPKAFVELKPGATATATAADLIVHRKAAPG